MKIGVTGHQDRRGIDWRWVRASLLRRLRKLDGEIEGLTSLAKGADQIFAQCVLDVEGSLTAVIPTTDYEMTFAEEDRASFRKLLSRSNVIMLNLGENEPKNFRLAGEWIVRSSDLVCAIWDGKPAHGAGGTGDIVAYARQLKKPLYHLDTEGRREDCVDASY